MSFEIVRRSNGQVVPLANFVDGLEFQPRERNYAIQHGRAVEAPHWGVFGDGLEQPSIIRLRVRLNPDKYPTRAAQRHIIDTFDDLVTDAAVLRNLPDMREYAVFGGRIMSEAPTEETYWLDLTFWPTVRKAAFTDGFPLGTLRATEYGAGFVVVEPLPGAQLSSTLFTLTDGVAAFQWNALEATYG